jgi:hypothetical protein
MACSCECRADPCDRVVGEPYATIDGCMRDAIERGPQKTDTGMVHIFSCGFDESEVTARQATATRNLT